MNNYEKLLDQAALYHLNIYENYDFSGTRIKGLYCDGAVALGSDLSGAERSCVLAEEIGHHLTSSGDIIDLSQVQNRKQEQHARAWAYRNLIDLRDFIRAYNAGCRNRYELAEFLEVTEDFLSGAIQFFLKKYGTHTRVDNYVIFFEPLGILELQSVLCF